MSKPPISRDEGLRLLLSRRGELIAYLYSYVRDLHIAEDLFQDVTLRMVDRHAEILDADKAFAWARSVARNRAIDWLRSEKHRPSLLDADALELLEREWEHSPKHDTNEMLDAVSHCVGRLTPRARQLVEMRFRNQMTAGEISETSGRKLQSVYAAFSRIYSTLGDCIKQKLADRGPHHG